MSRDVTNDLFNKAAALEKYKVSRVYARRCSHSDTLRHSVSFANECILYNIEYILIIKVSIVVVVVLVNVEYSLRVEQT